MTVRHSSADNTRARPPAPGGAFYARAREGYELPIIDVTHPRFAVADNTAALDRLREAYLREHRQRRFIPRSASCKIGRLRVR
jgi:hypothetical protein